SPAERAAAITRIRSRGGAVGGRAAWARRAAARPAARARQAGRRAGEPGARAGGGRGAAGPQGGNAVGEPARPEPLGHLLEPAGGGKVGDGQAAVPGLALVDGGEGRRADELRRR